MLLVLFNYSELYQFYQDRSKCFKYLNTEQLINENVNHFRNIVQIWQCLNWNVVGTITNSSKFDEFIDTFINKISENPIINCQLKKYHKRFNESLSKPKKKPKIPNRKITQDEKFEVLELYGNTRIVDIRSKLGLTWNQCYKVIYKARHTMKELLENSQISDDIKSKIEYIKTCIPPMPFTGNKRYIKATPSLNGYKEFLINTKII